MQLQQRKGGVGGWGAACRKKKKSELFSRSLEGITLLGYQEAVSKAAAVWQAGVWIRLPDTSPHRTFSLWFQVDEKSGLPLGDVLRIEAGVFCGATLSVMSGGQMDGQTALICCVESALFAEIWGQLSSTDKIYCSVFIFNRVAQVK